MTSEVLSEGYRKARRDLMLFSALLLAWEIIGIEIPAQSELPGVGTPVTILSPGLLPFVLAILVFYFGYRLQIEWRLLDISIRMKNASKASKTASFDHRTTQVLATFAVGAWAIQGVVAVRLFEPLEVAIAVASLLGIGGTVAYAVFRSRSRRFRIAELKSDIGDLAEAIESVHRHFPEDGDPGDHADWQVEMARLDDSLESKQSELTELEGEPSVSAKSAKGDTK